MGIGVRGSCSSACRWQGPRVTGENVLGAGPHGAARTHAWWMACEHARYDMMLERYDAMAHLVQLVHGAGWWWLRAVRM